MLACLSARHARFNTRPKWLVVHVCFRSSRKPGRFAGAQPMAPPRPDATASAMPGVLSRPRSVVATILQDPCRHQPDRAVDQAERAGVRHPSCSTRSLPWSRSRRPRRPLDSGIVLAPSRRVMLARFTIARLRRSPSTRQSWSVSLRRRPLHPGFAGATERLPVGQDIAQGCVPSGSWRSRSARRAGLRQ